MEKALPIQCVEAVFIAVYLTQNASGFPGQSVFPDCMTRLTLRFKSCLAGNPRQTHRHIVLAIRLPEGQWGAVGISRRGNLQDKAFVHASLSELVLEYALSYREVGHVLRKVYVGLPLPQGAANHAALQWRAAALRLPLHLLPPAEKALGACARPAWQQASAALHKFEEALPALESAWKSRGRISAVHRKAHRCAVQLPAPTAAAAETTAPGDSSSSDDECVDTTSSAAESGLHVQKATRGEGHGQLQLTLGGV